MLRLFCAFLFLAAACSAPRDRAPEEAGTRSAASAAAQRGIEARRIHWQRSVADVKALAAASGRPLLLALNMDGESASDRIVHELYRDPEFVALTRRCVCAGASVFRHQARDHDEHGRRLECPRFPVAPRHALVLPNGTKAFDLSLNFDFGDVTRALAAALADVPAEARTAAADTDDWRALASRRDAAGRDALEAAVATARDDATIGEAIAAVAAHGDAGSLEALRPLFARADELAEATWNQLTAAARALDGAGTNGIVREIAQTLGPLPAMPGDPDASGRTTKLMDSDGDAAAKSFVAARLAVGDGYPASPFDDVVDLHTLLQVAAVVTRREGSPPRPGVPQEPRLEADALDRLLTELDRVDAAGREQAEWQARFAKASLDLGRVQWEANAKGAQLLFDDAARYFERATAAPDAKYEWWIERARCAFYRSRFAEQAECAERALAIAAGMRTPPREKELLTGALLEDARAIEALRWLGDAHARLGAERATEPLTTQFLGSVLAVRSLGIVAASPFGRDADWVTFASCCSALGLRREHVAAAWHGAMRHPLSRELREALNAGLWQCGRPDWMPLAAEAIEAAHPPTAESAWFAGYAWLLAAEDLRRRDEPRAAVVAYGHADAWFRRTSDRDAKYADDTRYHAAVVRLGQGMAHASVGDRAAAADDLRMAVLAWHDLSQVRDGLGADVLDLVDRCLEWRSSGPSEVDAADLLTRLGARTNDAFLVGAIADAALREALRADGRNPERREQRTVDAGGKPITMAMGLPTALGDQYLQQAIEVGRRAAANARNDEDRVVLAQALTIAVERQLVRDVTTGLQPLLAEAAPLVGMAAPGADADLDALRATVAALREKLGPARPRFRDGR
jgi:tetratricopeptide (TPR) repeat protein